MNTYREQAEKHFNKVLKGPLVLAVLTISIGALLLITGVNELIVAPTTPVLCCVAMILVGAGHVMIGIWGVSFSKRRRIEFLPDALILYERGIILVLGWLTWVLAGIFTVATFCFCLEYEPGASMVFSVLGVVLLFLAFTFFALYRNRRIVLQRSLVERVDLFGRSVTYSRVEVLGMIKNRLVGGYIFIGSNGKSLFSCERSMVNSAAFLHEMSAQMYGEQSGYTEERQEMKDVLLGEAFLEEVKKDSWQVRHRKGIQIGGLLLGIFNVAATLLLFYVYVYGDFLKGRYYYLIQTLLPLSYYIFAWIFKDVVLWGPFDGNRYHFNWKERYIAIYASVLFGIFFQTIVVLQSLMLNMHCIRGVDRVITFGAAVFGVLVLISVLCLGFRKPKRELRGQWMLIALFSIFFSVEITEGIFLATSKTPVHYEADVVDTNEYSGRRTSYYADVILKDGSTEHIEISKYVYERIGRQEPVVICDRTGMFGTEFVTIHKLE